MRKRFSRAAIAVSAAAVVASSLSLSLGTASASTQVPTGTPACGPGCVNLFSKQLGSNTTMNAYVPGDTGTGGKVGQKVNLHLYGNFRPNGDWNFSLSGAVFQFCGLLANDFFSPTSYVCLHMPFAPVFEMVWSPFGNETTLCAGVAKPGVTDEDVTLQTCGMSPDTLWIGDQAHGQPGGNCLSPVPGFALPVAAGQPGNVFVHYCPWINGGDTKFAQPLVLTLDTGTTKPTNQLQLEPELLVGGVARSNQLFAFWLGSL